MSAVSTTIVPFPISNEQFLAAVFGNRWGDALVAYFLGDPEKGADWRVYPAANVLAVMTASHNNYWDVSLPQPGGGRTGRDFAALYAIVIDDWKVKVDPATIEQLLGRPPSYVIETSPGNFHAGWFVEPLTDRAWVNGLLRALYEALGRKGDNLVKPTTLVRLPVGTNGKAGLGAAGFRVRLTHWQPDNRIKYTDWIDIEKRIGAVTPVDPGASLDNSTPDPAELEADPILKVFRTHGMVQDHGRSMTFGWGFEVTCPWAGEHTDPRSAASYVPVKGRFKCHHGHCQDRTMADLREWADASIREDSGGLETLASQEFDNIEVDPPIRHASGPLGGAIDLWDQKTLPTWPGGILPAVLEDTLFELSQSDGLDLGALGATMITAASGAADKRASLTPYADAQWAVPPVLWLMLIAEPGLRKTAVLAYLLGLLRKRNAERMRAYALAMTGWRATPAAARGGPAPAVRALLAEDTTIEKLQEWMADNSRGLLYLRDELASLFEFGRYSNGGGTAERANFLEFYEGGPTTIGRMTRTTSIDNCALSIIGGIQPHRLADFKGLGDDGLLPRFGTILMQRTQAVRKTTPPDITAINAMIERLLLLGPDAYRTDAAGEDVIRDIEKMGEGIAQRTDIGVSYRGFLRKLHGTHARAALVLHLIDGGQDQVVPADTIMRAARYTVFLLDHAEMFYAGLAGSAEHTAQAIGSYILRNPAAKTRVTAGQLRRDVAACKPLRTLREIQDALFLLIIGGWLVPETNYPTNSAWRVRPGLQDQFAARITSETVRTDGVKRSMNHRGLYRPKKTEIAEI